MDLREETLKEHSKKQTLKITAWIGDEDDRYRQFLQLFLYDDYRVVQRISWVLSLVAESHPKLVEKHLGKIINRLDDKDIHVAVKRNVIRVLQFLNIPKKFHAKVFNHCINYMCDPTETVAVRCFSMTVAVKLSDQYPELAGEVMQTISAMLKNPSQTLTAGLKARAKKELKILEKLVGNDSVRDISGNIA